MSLTYKICRTTPLRAKAPMSLGNAQARPHRTRTNRSRTSPILRNGISPQRIEISIRRKETVEEWATRILLHAYAIAPCPDHGYMRLKFSHQGIDYVRALAEFDRYPNLSKLMCIEGVDAVFDSLSDDCPGCE